MFAQNSNALKVDASVTRCDAAFARTVEQMKRISIQIGLQ